MNEDKPPIDLLREDIRREAAHLRGGVDRIEKLFREQLSREADQLLEQRRAVSISQNTRLIAAIVVVFVFGVVAALAAQVRSQRDTIEDVAARQTEILSNQRAGLANDTEILRRLSESLPETTPAEPAEMELGN